MRVPALTDIARILAVTTQRVFFSAASLATGEPSISRSSPELFFLMIRRPPRDWPPACHEGVAVKARTSAFWSAGSPAAMGACYFSGACCWREMCEFRSVKSASTSVTAMDRSAAC